ncbi:YnfU family zinc-binding protein [Pantoea septica]|uniref:YnfU family zinc-binding protein n=1 Tax=Pantoea septica TaxID=472695 RepID=UPI0035E3C612
MSYFTQIMDRITKATNDAQCPVCNKYSKQSVPRITKEQVMLCPHCKSMFVVHSQHDNDQ